MDTAKSKPHDTFQGALTWSGSYCCGCSVSVITTITTNTLEQQTFASGKQHCGGIYAKQPKPDAEFPAHLVVSLVIFDKLRFEAVAALTNN